MHAGTSPRSRALAATEADLALVAAPDVAGAAALRAGLRAEASAAGRDPDDLKVIVPVLPVVAVDRGAARAIVERLLALVPIDDGTAGRTERVAFPANRSLDAFLDLAGFPSDDPARSVSVDSGVAAAAVDRFAEPAARVAAFVGRRAGLTPGEGLTWRHLIAANAVPANFLVGGPADVADHFERWRDEEAADGFNVLSAFQPSQFEAFAQLAVPELRRRGLIGRSGATLRERLGLGAPQLAYAPASVLSA
ncbi:LLM class flavin-dependent oxidoreductase [Microbacterium sp. RU33B]|uniref:LLM class flavin-dependent oxidoreductase n=1 Tax=Microbacterium sp. RU33B TaxID=1907390 RepID=UPI002115FD56|nr:LLM class flavin-dependent oxidoreductase [Microbacterium sp. RU33B]